YRSSSQVRIDPYSGTSGINGGLISTGNANGLSLGGAIDTVHVSIKSNGNVGIGTTSPSSKLDIFGTTAAMQLSYDASNYNKLSIGSDGTLTMAGVSAGGSLTTIARYSPSQVNFDVPTSFNAAGDVSMAYDLIMANQTSSQIESYGPLSIIAGEAFENNNLTLKTYGTGKLIVESSNFWSDGTNVGIGTTGPGAKLEVNSTLRLSDGSVDSGELQFGLADWKISNTVANGGLLFQGWSGSYADVLFLDDNGSVGIGSTNPGNNKLKIVGSLCVKSDDAACAGSTAGTIYATTTTVASADYAEYFRTNDTDLQSGEVVCIDTLNSNSVKRCTNASDTNVMGIVSTSPAVLGNATEETVDNPNYKAIAMLGQIPAKVSNENGAVRIGDSLTAASIAGHVMKANAGDSTVGVALESFGDGPLADAQDDRTGVIQVMISRRNKSLTVEAVEEKVAERVAAMEIEEEVNRLVASAVAQLTPQNSLTLDENGNVVLSSDTTSTVDLFTSISSSDSFKSYMNTVDQPDIRIDELDDRLQSVEDRLNTLEQASASASLDTLNDRVGFLEQIFTSLEATQSADLSTYLAGLIETQVLGIQSDVATMSALTVTGDTNVNNLAVTGEISSGLLTINGFDDSLATPAATISTLGGSLKLQHLGLGEIEFMAGKSRIDTDGNFIISEGDLVIETGVIKGNDQIRGIDLPVVYGDNTLEVFFDTPKTTTEYAVNITPNWLTNLAVTEKRTDGFVIEFSTLAPLGATIDWVILE
ncbi:hypothetical protein KBD81_03660, partial [Candidatus Woesebacteria bacterium]|nr:hypothetical protein [Candidatus Woesebacteria bacterium]